MDECMELSDSLTKNENLDPFLKQLVSGMNIDYIQQSDFIEDHVSDMGDSVDFLRGAPSDALDALMVVSDEGSIVEVNQDRALRFKPGLSQVNENSRSLSQDLNALLDSHVTENRFGACDEMLATLTSSNLPARRTKSYTQPLRFSSPDLLPLPIFESHEVNPVQSNTLQTSEELQVSMEDVYNRVRREGTGSSMTTPSSNPFSDPVAANYSMQPMDDSKQESLEVLLKRLSRQSAKSFPSFTPTASTVPASTDYLDVVTSIASNGMFPNEVSEPLRQTQSANFCHQNILQQLENDLMQPEPACLPQFLSQTFTPPFSQSTSTSQNIPSLQCLSHVSQPSAQLQNLAQTQQRVLPSTLRQNSKTTIAQSLPEPRPLPLSLRKSLPQSHKALAMLHPNAQLNSNTTTSRSRSKSQAAGGGGNTSVLDHDSVEHAWLVATQGAALRKNNTNINPARVKRKSNTSRNSAAARSEPQMEAPTLSAASSDLTKKFKFSTNLGSSSVSEQAQGGGGSVISPTGSEDTTEDQATSKSKRISQTEELEQLLGLDSSPKKDSVLQATGSGCLSINVAQASPGSHSQLSTQQLSPAPCQTEHSTANNATEPSTIVANNNIVNGKTSPSEKGPEGVQAHQNKILNGRTSRANSFHELNDLGTSTTSTQDALIEQLRAQVKDLKDKAREEGNDRKAERNSLHLKLQHVNRENSRYILQIENLNQQVKQLQKQLGTLKAENERLTSEMVPEQK